MAKEQRYRGLQNDYHENKQQAALRQKYKVAGNATVKIENPVGSVVRVLIQSFGRVIVLLARIGILLLACTGLATLIYPSIRVEFLREMNQTLSQIMAWL